MHMCVNCGPASDAVNLVHLPLDPSVHVHDLPAVLPTTPQGEQQPPCTRYPSQMHECYVRCMFLLLMHTKALTSSKNIHPHMFARTTREGPRTPVSRCMRAHDTTGGIPPKPHTRSTASWTAADTHVHRSVCDKTH